jgi:replication factor C subunit 2/4
MVNLVEIIMRDFCKRQKVDKLDLPWVEKYRPSNISEIIGNTEVLSKLQKICNYGNLPNLILTGPSGTGKTTSILCLAHTLLGQNYNAAVLELNASDDRGIEMVRTKIKIFAQKKLTLRPGRHKIIILDEADSMTTSAQQVLRRIMEQFSTSTRFVITCNQPDKLIDTVQSNCAIIRFSKLLDQEILGRLLIICEAENVPYSDEGLMTIIYTSDGDMRQSLNNLQATYIGYGLVNQENVFKVCDHPHPILLSSLLTTCISGNIKMACKKMESLYNLGHSTSDIISTLYKVALTIETIREYTKLEILKLIGLTQLRIGNGLHTRLQLIGLISKLCKLRT